jgi:DNA recombination protein RmuC
MNMIAMVALAAFLIGLMTGLVIWHRGTRALRAESEQLRIRLAALDKQRETDAEKIGWGVQAEERLREAFAALSSKALQENAAQLAERAQTDLRGIVEPLKENLTTFGEHVRELEKDRKGAYESLNQQLKTLGETHHRLQETTLSLTQALKSPTARGRWGELQLRRVVELAGMVNHIAFDEQMTGETGRPDMIVYLPNHGILPIDAKVPLDAYLVAMEATDPETRKRQLALHARALRERARQLSQKSYWDQFETAPDFVVMFVPNEACLGAAFESDSELLEYAIQNRVLISSPVTLLALLRAVAYGWQQHAITDNARKIAQEGKELYARVTTFVDHLAEVGRHLGRSVEVYNKAVGSFERRLVPAVRRLQELGVSSSELEEPATIEVHPALPARMVEGEGEGKAEGEERGA